MRVVIQRVSEASVSINETTHSSIKKGLLIFVGIEDSDSINDVDGDILLVSQFTLFASTKKGNRPSYIKASKPKFAITIYESMIKQLQAELRKTIKTGVFGADMKIGLVNDGPITILIDSKNKE
jgi:D-tyrosyl-tRNA(Tyr) deacylase